MFYSPLRYPGGKGKLVQYFKDLIKRNYSKSPVYIEPYVGGGSVALSLLIEGYVNKIIINDLDRSIYAFWYCVLNKTEELCHLIEQTPITINIWKKQKEIQKEKQDRDILKLGFSTFFLNRTDHSGIINAGVIGGLKQDGKWKINARFNKEELIKRIRKIASYKDKIELHNEDAVILIQNLSQSLSSNVLFYLDPPYYIKGKELYLNYYNQEDHQRIFNQIREINGQKWVITYDDVWAIRKLYQDFKKSHFYINYSAGKTGKGKEIIIFSDNLKGIKPKISMNLSSC